MKKLLCMVLAILVFASSIVPAAWAGEVDILVRKLVEKGILDESEGKVMLEEIRFESAKKDAVKKQEIVEEAQEDIAELTRKEIESILVKQNIAKPKKDSFQVYWKDGLRFDTADKNFKLKVGGRIMAHTAWQKQETKLKDTVGKASGSAEFRRARLYMSGDIYKDFFFKAQYDFAGGDADFKDVYLGMKNIPYLGAFKIGHFKEPFSLEELTSSKYITFMERGLPNVFAPSRNWGAEFSNTLFNKRATWAAGIFRPSDGYGNYSGSGWNFTGRLTALPWYEDKGEKLLHIGTAWTVHDPRGTVRYRQRPEDHLSPRYVDTGTFQIDYASLFNVELALVYGPFSLQSEFIQGWVDQSHNNSSHTCFPSFYAYASYFLTGEHRKYKTSKGCFSRVKPKKNFSIKDKTWGAWELGVRYSYLDLEDKNIEGGIMQDITAGVNWHWNPNMRVMGNYVHSNRNRVGGADILEARFQVDF